VLLKQCFFQLGTMCEKYLLFLNDNISCLYYKEKCKCCSDFCISTQDGAGWCFIIWIIYCKGYLSMFGIYYPAVERFLCVFPPDEEGKNEKPISGHVCFSVELVGADTIKCQMILEWKKETSARSCLFFCWAWQDDEISARQCRFCQYPSRN